jgi:hypothetical protein
MKHMLWLKNGDNTVEKYVEIMPDFNSQKQVVATTYRWILKRLSRKTEFA